jgi:hypothetical protein
MNFCLNVKVSKDTLTQKQGIAARLHQRAAANEQKLGDKK